MTRLEDASRLNLYSVVGQLLDSIYHVGHLHSSQLSHYTFVCNFTSKDSTFLTFSIPITPPQNHNKSKHPLSPNNLNPNTPKLTRPRIRNQRPIQLLARRPRPLLAPKLHDPHAFIRQNHAAQYRPLHLENPLECMLADPSRQIRNANVPRAIIVCMRRPEADEKHVQRVAAIHAIIHGRHNLPRERVVLELDTHVAGESICGCVVWHGYVVYLAKGADENLDVEVGGAFGEVSDDEKGSVGDVGARAGASHF